MLCEAVFLLPVVVVGDVTWILNTSNLVTSPYLHTQPTHTTNTHYQHTLPTHTTYTPYLHTLPTHTPYTPYIHTLPTHTTYTPLILKIVNIKLTLLSINKK